MIRSTDKKMLLSQGQLQTAEGHEVRSRNRAKVYLKRCCLVLKRLMDKMASRPQANSTLHVSATNSGGSRSCRRRGMANLKRDGLKLRRKSFIDSGCGESYGVTSESYSPSIVCRKQICNFVIANFPQWRNNFN